ncbi:putative aquaporin SIP2-1 [Bienertia sinuspersici]
MGENWDVVSFGFVLSFMWVCSGVFVKIFVFKILDSIMMLLEKFWCNSGGFSRFLFVIGARIPAQVLGAIYGVKFLIYTFPEIGWGPKLNVNIHHGALTEGILTFMVVFISMSVSRSIPGVMGWAYARGDHITKEHIFVYWLAPIEATLLAVWVFMVVFPKEKEKADTKSKSE